MKILFISLGCDKNLVDAEEMLGLLRRENYEFTDDETQAEVIIVNTCCFVGDAKEESIETILQMAAYKESGSLKALLVTGCLAQRYKEEIIREIPEVDAVLGTSSYDKIAEAIKVCLQGQRYEVYETLERLIVKEEDRVLTTGGYYAYLKIAEGCDKCCTYCIIPKVRGRYRSVPMEEVVASAKRLADKGVKELILVAQETTVYGVDLVGKKLLPQLLRELCKISGFVFIRLLYCYPEEITDELIEVMRTEPKICHYIDMPIQHANDRILKLMGRRTCKQELKDVVKRLREAIPDIVIRTTLITGFPTETRKEHEELMAFVDEMCFERLGVFTYSPEEDTPAEQMEGQIPEEEKERRRGELMTLQQEIAFDNGVDMVGRELLVLIEGKLVEEDVYIGRTYMDAPNVDGSIFVASQAELLTGDVVKVVVTGAKEYDLIGEIIP